MALSDSVTFLTELGRVRLRWDFHRWLRDCGSWKFQNGEEAFRWTSAGMVGLGGFAGSSVNSYARATSADGSVVVGQAHDDLE